MGYWRVIYARPGPGRQKTYMLKDRFDGREEAEIAAAELREGGFAVCCVYRRRGNGAGNRQLAPGRKGKRRPPKR